MLVTNLIDAPGADQQSAAKFAAGLSRVKRARDLALDLIGPPGSDVRAFAPAETEPEDPDIAVIQSSGCPSVRRSRSEP
jgi:hypothetical protein